MRQAILRSRTVGSFAPPVQGAQLVECVGLTLAGRGAVRADRGSNTWPTHTSLWCWHCAHPFATPPVPKPTSFDPARRVFRVKGNYCSWACAAADCRNMHEQQHLQALHQEVLGRGAVLRPAPPRCMLKPFGGPLAVDDFRQDASRDYREVPARMVEVDPVRVQAEERVRLRAAPKVDFSGVTARNDMLKLKRDKPLAAGRGLMSVQARIVR